MTPAQRTTKKTAYDAKIAAIRTKIAVLREDMVRLQRERAAIPEADKPKPASKPKAKPASKPASKPKAKLPNTKRKTAAA